MNNREIKSKYFEKYGNCAMPCESEMQALRNMLDEIGANDEKSIYLALFGFQIGKNGRK